MLDAATIKRLEEALAAQKLKELSDQMRAEGLHQVEIYDRFESFWVLLGNANREADSDILGDHLECIVGWCNPAACWFDHYLTNEEIYAYRSGLTEQEFQEIS